MTLTVQTPKIQYIGNGVTVLFTYTFTVQDDSDLVVTVDDVTQVEFSDYTVENITPAGGDVVFVVAPPDQSEVLIVRSTPIDQQTDYKPFDPFEAETMEYTLDKLTAILQEIEGNIIDGGGSPSPAPVQSVFGRIGNVIALYNDYQAGLISYENAFSGLTATNVQDAIDEIVLASSSFDGKHTSLTDVLPDQHHDKSHAHDGSDGSGTVDYNDLTNKPTLPSGVHNDLSGRSDADAHPISAITNLQGTLDLKVDFVDAVARHSDQHDYIINDICNYTGILYVCIVDHFAQAFSLTNWKPVTQAVGTGVQFSYKWTSSLSGDPADGHVGVNDADPTIATELRISKLTRFGTDVTTFLETWQVGDYFAFEEIVGDHEAVYYQIASVAIDNATYYAFSVIYVGGKGIPENNRNGIVSYVLNPDNKLPKGGTAGQHLTKVSASDFDTNWTDPPAQTYLHADLTDVSPDQHHPQSHTHDGSDGSGVIDYGDILNPPVIPVLNWTLSGNNIYNANSGNVGIGTATPSQKLHVNGGGITVENAGNFASVFRRTGTSPASHTLAVGGNRATHTMKGNVVEEWNISAYSDLRITETTFGTVLTILPNGNFGIGTTTPDAILDVNGGVLVGTAPTGGDQGTGTVNISGNYYINGVPISSFIDAPIDGNLYARKDASWASIGLGAGTVTDLSNVASGTTVEIQNTGGDNTIIAGATNTKAGVMTAQQVTDLENVVGGNVSTGVWTPQFNRVGVFDNQYGSWMRIGDMVTMVGGFFWSGMNNAGQTGQVEIMQLPFVPLFVGGAQYAGAGKMSGMTGLDWLSGQKISLGCVSANKTIIMNASFSTSSGVTPADQRLAWLSVENTGYIHFNFSYQAVPL